MQTTNKALGFLSGNMLKLIAASAMLIDHIGVVLFPGVLFLRIIGRLAFPIFAFMIAEGARYTKNKLRHFLTIFIFAAAIQAVYYLFMNDTYMSILVTFSLSILVIYALELFKRTLFRGKGISMLTFLAGALLIVSVLGVWGLNHLLTIDYGFSGCMVAVLTSLFMLPKSAPAPIRKLDTTVTHILMCGIGLLFLALEFGWIQYYALLALPLLLLYSGRRGKWNMKYFFYIFYPLHLVILQAIAWFLM